MSRRWRSKKPAAKKNKLSPEDAAFMRGFGTALASIWRCHHDGQMVQHLIKANNFKLGDFRDLDIDVDYEMIRQALRSRGLVDKTPAPRRRKS
jgi:hypothetical protein